MNKHNNNFCNTQNVPHSKKILIRETHYYVKMQKTDLITREFIYPNIPLKETSLSAAAFLLS